MPKKDFVFLKVSGSDSIDCKKVHISYFCLNASLNLLVHVFCDKQAFLDRNFGRTSEIKVLVMWEAMPCKDNKRTIISERRIIHNTTTWIDPVSGNDQKV